MRTARVVRIFICAAIICSIIVIALPGAASACTDPVTVYRLYNKVTGEHLYTSDINEKHAILDKYPGVWVYEGVGYVVDGAVAADPLYRFYNKKNGTHFYTADPVEKERVKNTLASVYAFEGAAFNVSRDPGAGAGVYRFYNKKTGSHFYTADEAEKNAVLAKLGGTYTLEGQAYYLPY